MVIPELKLHPNDIGVIFDTLRSYVAYVRSNQSPSAGRGMLLVTIENLQSRLASLRSGTDEQTVLLSPMELQVIDQALTHFIQAVPLVVKQSKTRDEVLAACQNLEVFVRGYLSAQGKEEL
jgi:hypothetical protein